MTTPCNVATHGMRMEIRSLRFLATSWNLTALLFSAARAGLNFIQLPFISKILFISSRRQIDRAGEQSLTAKKNEMPRDTCIVIPGTGVASSVVHGFIKTSNISLMIIFFSLSWALSNTWLMKHCVAMVQISPLRQTTDGWMHAWIRIVHHSGEM